MSALEEVLRKLACGQLPADVPADCECREQALELVCYLDEIRRFVAALTSGDLNITMRRPGSLAGNLKALHGNLRHLTWQTQQVAAGDFSQRVDFMGTFSDAFNSMVAALAKARNDLTEKNLQLADTLSQLQTTQSQLLQQEKMASIGQLAAGVAHEINNPMGFIAGNLAALSKYTDRLKAFIQVVDEALALPGAAEAHERVTTARKSIKVDFMLEDIPNLLAESADGAGRVRQIVQNLKEFSRVDSIGNLPADINQCLDSTITIIWDELKNKAKLTKEYGDLPQVTCRPQQLNQVFMNLLQNAAQAIENNGEIKVVTRHENNDVFIEISDNGCGIPPENLSRIFEPFFTTRPVGKGTGLGLSISYDIVKKHGGDIHVSSTVGVGTTFRVRIPLIPLC